MDCSPTEFLSCFVLAFSASPSGIHPFPLWHSPLPPRAFTPSPSGIHPFPLWGKAGMGAGYGKWCGLRLAAPPPTPSPSGGGNAFSLSRLRERVRVRVLLPPAHLCSVPSGLLSFPLWGKVGMGAVHGPEYEQVKQQISGWPPPSPSPKGGGKESPSPLPSPTSGRGSTHRRWSGR